MCMFQMTLRHGNKKKSYSSYSKTKCKVLLVPLVTEREIPLIGTWLEIINTKKIVNASF